MAGAESTDGWVRDAGLAALWVLAIGGCASSPAQQPVVPPPVPQAAEETAEQAGARCRQALAGCRYPRAYMRYPHREPECQGIAVARQVSRIEGEWVCICDQCRSGDDCKAPERCFDAAAGHAKNRPSVCAEGLPLQIGYIPPPCVVH